MGLESDIAVLFNTLLHAVGVGSHLAKSEIHACIRELNLQSDLLVFPGENEGKELGSLSGLWGTWHFSC